MTYSSQVSKNITPTYFRKRLQNCFCYKLSFTSQNATFSKFNLLFKNNIIYQVVKFILIRKDYIIYKHPESNYLQSHRIKLNLFNYFKYVPLKINE